MKRLTLVLTAALGGLGALLAHAAAPIPVQGGPLLQRGPVHVQFAIYYLGTSPRDPVGAVRALAGAGKSGPRWAATLPAEPAQPLVAARLEPNAQANYRPPDMEMLQRFGRGISREQALALQKSDRALVLDFVHPPALAAPSLRAALVIAEKLARDGQGLL